MMWNERMKNMEIKCGMWLWLYGGKIVAPQCNSKSDQNEIGEFRIRQFQADNPINLKYSTWIEHKRNFNQKISITNLIEEKLIHDSVSVFAYLVRKQSIDNWIVHKMKCRTEMRFTETIERFWNDMNTSIDWNYGQRYRKEHCIFAFEWNWSKNSLH